MVSRVEQWRARRGRWESGQPRQAFTRRAFLRAGLAGAAVLVGAALIRPRAARAAAPADATSAPGVFAFNQDWLFGGEYVAGAEAPGYSESGFTPVTLPHTVTPLSWGDWDATTWEHVWVYRKHIAASSVSGRRVFVDFQGVMTNATVFLGGTRIAQHQGGYLPFSVELTAGLAPGDNVLAVSVDANWLDVPPSGDPRGAWTVDYLQPGGIYRDVTLRIVPEVFIADVFAKPVDVLSASRAVDVEFIIDAGAIPSGPVILTATLLDGTTPLASATGTTTVSAEGTSTATLTIRGIANVTLWSPDTPKLYQVSGSLVADGISHTVQIRTGFRQATFQDGGFYLNGQRLEVFGLNRHQLFPYTGMAAPERLQRRDAELLKNELNCNMVRCSHYPQSPHFLDACDELGLMVWEEPPGWQYMGDAAFQAIVVQNVQDMVVRDRSRPSVIVWATRLNETANYAALYAETRQLAYTLDGTRQTTGAMYTQNTSGWAEDMFAYDDYHSASNNTQAILEPPLTTLPYMVSEAVGALDGKPLYRWIDSEATLALQAQMHAQVHSLAQSNAAYAGLLGWAGIDYASLSGGNRIWHNVKWPGVLDTFRVPKPGAAVYQSQVDPGVRPVILPVFFWDFGPSSPAGGPGQTTMFATNCDSLEIYVNGQYLTTGTPDAQAYPGLAHPPVIVDLSHADVTGDPDLLVNGYVGGQPAATLQMSSDPSRDKLVLTIEDASISGDGTDATRFTFRALDVYGNQRPYVSGQVTLTLVGPAALIADNPFPLDEYGGVGGGFIRSQPATAGVVTVTAAHPTLGQASGQVTVQAAAAAALPSTPPGTWGSTPPPPAPRTSPRPGSPPPPPPAAHPPAPAVITRAQVRAALARVLRPRGAAGTIQALLRHGGYTVHFDAPSGGKLALDWYHVPKVVARRSRPRPVRVASASRSVRRAGPVAVKIALTASGRSLLRHAERERLTATASFAPTGEPATRSSQVITVARGPHGAR